MFIYMICKFQIVWKRIAIVSLSAEGFKTEQRAAIKFCTKLKKTATEVFEMLKCVR
jgi:hypothetical protein